MISGAGFGGLHPEHPEPAGGMHEMAGSGAAKDAVRSLRFLVVDDSEDIRDVLVRLVERLGHTARAASDGVEAVELLANDRFDVMLLDLTMPRMSGEDVVRWLKKHPGCGQGMRVVIVSAWAGERRAHLQELGVHAILSKPLRAHQLRDLINETSWDAPS
jgi:CheY-like chemotaxis protein